MTRSYSLDWFLTFGLSSLTPAARSYDSIVCLLGLSRPRAFLTLVSYLGGRIIASQSNTRALARRWLKRWARVRLPVVGVSPFAPPRWADDPDVPISRKIGDQRYGTSRDSTSVLVRRDGPGSTPGRGNIPFCSATLRGRPPTSLSREKIGDQRYGTSRDSTSVLVRRDRSERVEASLKGLASHHTRHDRGHRHKSPRTTVK